MSKIIKLNKLCIKIILLIILFFGVQNISFAEVQQTKNECYIQNGPANVLQQYLNNVEKVLNNVTNQVKTKVSKQGFLEKITQFDKFKTQGIRFYNSITSWDGYFGSFDFYAILPVFNHVPYPVKRDYKLIENNINYLGDYYENLVTNGVSDIVIENPCDGVENCKLSGTSIDIVSKLIESSDSILSLYTARITNNNTSSKKSFILVPINSFENEFGDYYNKNTLENCSNAEGDKGFMDTIKKSWNKIKENGILSKNAIKDWKDSWNLILGIKNGQNLYEMEHKLLSEELGRQGISGNNADIILGNLEESNSKPLSFGNNPIVNSIKNTFNGNFGASRSSWTSFGEKWSGFSESIYQTYSKYQQNFGVGNNNGIIQINDLNEINEEITKSKNIEKRINDLSIIENSLAQNQDTNNENLLSRIIELHINLSQATNVLDKTIPIAEKACNRQDTGNGICNYRN